MSDTFQPLTGSSVPPQPPRITGDPIRDLLGLRDYLNAFYQAAVLETGLLDPSYQQTVGTISADNLPDPTATTIARAQATANQIYERFVHRFPVLPGTFTVSEAETTKTIEFSESLGDTDYVVLITPQTFSGSPNVNAFIPLRVLPGSDGFSALFNAAPGAGNSVTFSYFIARTTEG